MFYTVKSGDTFWSIAAQHGVSVQSLMAANPGVNPQFLFTGQTIFIPRIPTAPLGAGFPPPVGIVGISQRVTRLERTVGQIEERLGQQQRQIADLQARVSRLERQP
ncbi:MAG TPA: LysM peptidoglycan-binding domain-containing protein [Bacilli bacterium]